VEILASLRANTNFHVVLLIVLFLWDYTVYVKYILLFCFSDTSGEYFSSQDFEEMLPTGSDHISSKKGNDS
jgi:hypothetical protein